MSMLKGFENSVEIGAFAHYEQLLNPIVWSFLKGVKYRIKA